MMTAVVRRYALTCLLVGVCSGLTYGVWREVQFEPALPDIFVDATPPVKRADKIVVNVPAKSAFAQIADRPIFQPGRRPYVPPPAPQRRVKQKPVVPPPAPVVRSYKLVGTVIEKDSRAAWLKAAPTASPIRVMEGDVTQGWRVHRIEHDRVLFRAGAAVEVIELPKPILDPKPISPTKLGVGR